MEQWAISKEIYKDSTQLRTSSNILLFSYQCLRCIGSGYWGFVSQSIGRITYEKAKVSHGEKV